MDKSQAETNVFEAIKKYLQAAEHYNSLLSSKSEVSSNAVRECAYWAMMVLYKYNLSDNWTSQTTPKNAIPPQLADDIARNIQMILRGHIPQWMLHMQKTGAPVSHPRMAADIGLAVAYKKLADSGAINDSHSTKTISDLFGVDRKAVQNWMKQYSHVEPSLFFALAADDGERAKMIADDLPKAAERYREFGRGPKNKRPFDKALRRIRAKS
jgi:hypothetical protein